LINEEEEAEEDDRSSQTGDGKGRESKLLFLGAKFHRLDGKGFGKEFGPLEGREADRTSQEEFEVRGFDLFEEVLISRMMESAFEPQRQAEVVNLTHLSLMKAEAVQPLKGLLAGIEGVVVEALKLLPLPLTLLIPGRIEKGLIDPGADHKAGQIIVLLGEKASLHHILALGEETEDIGFYLLVGRLFGSNRLDEIDHIGHQFHKRVCEMHGVLLGKDKIRSTKSQPTSRQANLETILNGRNSKLNFLAKAGFALA